MASTHAHAAATQQRSVIAYLAYLPSLAYQGRAGWTPHWRKDGAMRLMPEGVTGTFDGLDDDFFRGLQALGVTRMWLSPPLDCPLDESGIGYNTQDYRRLSPLFGTEASFEALLARAQRHGIAVVMDLVLNHASVQHPVFTRAAIATRRSIVISSGRSRSVCRRRQRPSIRSSTTRMSP